MTTIPTSTIQIIANVKQNIKPLGGLMLASYLFNINFTLNVDFRL